MASFNLYSAAAATARGSGGGSPKHRQQQGGALGTKSQSGLPSIKDQEASAADDRSYVTPNLATASAPYGGGLQRSSSNHGLARTNSGTGLASASYMRGVMHQQAATRVSAEARA
jgi:hypothetical protein